MLPKGTKRGYGVCSNCHEEYSNRSKPKYCKCGNHLGGSFDSKKVKKNTVPEPLSVYIYSYPEHGTLTSCKVSIKGDRQFCFVKGNNRTCYTKKCLEIRTALVTSDKLEQFTCNHLKSSCSKPIYEVKFNDAHIKSLTPVADMAYEMIQCQMEHFPTVVKISEKSYATISKPSNSSPMRYVHVMVVIDKEGNQFVKCTKDDCKRKVGKTKQVIGRKLCLHQCYVLLARSLVEKLNEGSTQMTEAPSMVVTPSRNMSNNDIVLEIDTDKSYMEKSLNTQMSRYLPLEIPPTILKKSCHLQVGKSRLLFEPNETKCNHCESPLSSSLYVQGTNSSNGNGYLITNCQPFVKCDIKMKKCSNKECKAIVVCFPYDKGLFNVSNKVIISLDILVEWRHQFKSGMPISNIIKCKLSALLCKVEEKELPSESQVNYLADLLYWGFYTFEALTTRDINDAICGLCGIAGRMYYGDNNEKSFCALRNIDLKGVDHNTTTTTDDSSKLNTCVRNIKKHIIERGTFATSRALAYSMSLEDIPPMIPSEMLRQDELNTEAEKKSVYLKDGETIEGDPMALSMTMGKNGISLQDIETMDYVSLQDLSGYCNIGTQNKSQDLLRMCLLKLYSSILVGSSTCHEVVKSPGHTGGFYDIVCPHGTTVCSKFTVRKDSTVRDVADLYLSLKHPPVLFICETPCTFTQHVNSRCPQLAKEYWGEFNGCFEKPSLDKRPSDNLDVPDVIPSEYHDKNESLNKLSESTVKHPLTGNARRYVCGDKFHTQNNHHKSKLCEYHNVELCRQSGSIKTSYQESLNNRKIKKRNKSSCTQSIQLHIFYNYLMNYYENMEVVRRQRKALETSTGQCVVRDEFWRFTIS